MSELKSYTCVKCGAVLSVDKPEGQMACPFCGNEFDLVDFHREDLLLQAEECLARGAYESARERFNKLLANDPKDFDALFGRFLCASKWKSLKDIDINDKMFMSHVRKLPVQLDSIEKRISLQDQPLWQDRRNS